MTKNEIESFLVVIQWGSISAAAQQLYVTQPALSRMIKNLEDELGYTLFERGRGIRGIALTEQGRAFVPVAQKLKRAYDEATGIRDVCPKPVLHIAAIGSVSACVMPQILKKLSASDSPCKIDFNICHSSEAARLVESSSCDVALIDYMRAPQNSFSGLTVSIPLYSTRFILISAGNYASHVHISDLDPHKEICLTWNTQFDIWHERWFGSATQAKGWTKYMGVLPDMLTGDDYALIPENLGCFLASHYPELKIHQLVEGPPDELIYCITKEDLCQQESMLYFMELLKEHLAQLEGICCLLK